MLAFVHFFTKCLEVNIPYNMKITNVVDRQWEDDHVDAEHNENTTGQFVLAKFYV